MLTPVLFLGHGGGPLPLLGDPGHAPMLAAYRDILPHLPNIDYIVMISAHWEEEQVRITSGAHPDLIYDYYGFPEEAYSLRYPAPGAPALAERIQGLLSDRDIASSLDPERGFDHGMFVPLLLLYPEAQIPTIQISLRADLDPAFHIALGEALRPLREEGVLIVGSGLSFHNMQGLRGMSPPETVEWNRQFQQWLATVVMDDNLSTQDRHEALSHWQQAPHADYCHPREEHLLPLHVCQGAANGPARQSWSMPMGPYDNRCYLW